MNKFLGKKGQAAMEYFMTYGWMIMLIMIVGVVLWQLGVFGLSDTGGRMMIGFGNLRPLDWAMTAAADGDTILLINDEGSRVTVTRITMTGQSGETCGGNLPVPLSQGFATLIEPGDTAEFTMGAGPVPVAGSGCRGTAGIAYRIKVTIAYTRTVGLVTQTHEIVGTIRGIFE